MKKIYHKSKTCRCCWDSIEYDVATKTYKYFAWDDDSSKIIYSQIYSGDMVLFNAECGIYINETERKIVELFAV